MDKKMTGKKKISWDYIRQAIGVLILASVFGVAKFSKEVPAQKIKHEKKNLFELTDEEKVILGSGKLSQFIDNSHILEDGDCSVDDINHLNTFIKDSLNDNKTIMRPDQFSVLLEKKKLEYCVID